MYQKNHKARTDHVCATGCGKLIEKGTEYVQIGLIPKNKDYHVTCLPAHVGETKPTKATEKAKDTKVANATKKVTKATKATKTAKEATVTIRTETTPPKVEAPLTALPGRIANGTRDNKGRFAKKS